MGGRFDHEQDEEYSAATPPPQSTADSSISGDEAYAPSPKKRKGAHKKVVSVPVRDGSRSKSEVYPPPDSWSWRKYGQKPIKGSPYPRGYYRCSSSKGCPARKQVERSRLDPTTLLITYSCEHNHPHPHPHPTTTKNRHHQNPPSPVASSSSDPTSTSLSPEECGDAFSDQSTDNGFAELAGELGWLCNVGSTITDEMTLMVGPTHGPRADHVEFLNSTPIGEEDKFLFGDLGDLPESSLILRRYWAEAPCCGGTG